MKITRHLSERNLFAFALIWTIAITIASLVSLNNMPKVEVPGNDKTIHFIFYFVFTLLWYFALEKKIKKESLKFIIVSAAIIFGIIIEVLQSVLTQNRQADVFDALANSGGAFVALLVIFWLNSKTFKKKL
ncbi:VanZ family protein [Flavobacterium psychraquaticum]|uniref:VanZ family protein n=1 Tax=Flavobacterium psychraquaticum TaxID=3103958 RepID=UPI002ACE3276|nr:VanZ family protein [Flavobacterium sp. LB-N7T]